MKKLHQALALLVSFALLVIILITSFQAAIYGDFGFYKKEYEKYNVLPDLEMKMEDVMHVTHEMMAYLKGDRKALSVKTQVEGKKQDFFNKQDRLHMADVKRLFIGGLRLRTAAYLILVLCFLALLFLKADWKYILPRAFLAALGITIAAGLAVAGAFAVNFSAAFTKFHEIFFTNDLWLFDPAKDYMIRMLPEGLFSDMALRIGSFLGAGLLLLLIISVVWRKKTVKKISAGSIVY